MIMMIHQTNFTKKIFVQIIFVIVIYKEETVNSRTEQNSVIIFHLVLILRLPQVNVLTLCIARYHYQFLFCKLSHPAGHSLVDIFVQTDWKFEFEFEFSVKVIIKFYWSVPTNIKIKKNIQFSMLFSITLMPYGTCHQKDQLSSNRSSLTNCLMFSLWPQGQGHR